MIAISRVLLAFLMVCFSTLLILPLPAAKAQDVVAMHIGTESDKVSVYVGLSKSGQHKLFSLQNPSRIVLDLTNGNLAMGLPEPNEIFQASNGLITNVRSAQYNTNTYRLVFELNQEVRLSSQVLPASKDSAFPRIRINMQMLNAPKIVSKPFKPNVATPAPVNNPKFGKPVPSITANNQPKSNYQFDVGDKLIVAIDAGHGGKDPGAIGLNKTQEKKVVLSIAKKLADRINKHPRMKAVLTRTGDYYVGLGTRTKIARDAKADVFLSIHADAVKRRSAKGSSVYVLSNKRASSEFAKLLAQNENAAFADGVLNGKDKELKHVLLDMSKDYVLHESTLMATDILSSMTQVGAVHSRRIERASFAVLKSLDIPSVLIETAFISNPGEEKKLNNPNFQDQISLAIYNGLINYANRGIFEQIATHN